MLNIHPRDPAFMNIRQVASAFGVSKNTMYRLMAADPDAPRKLKLSRRLVVYKTADVMSWFERLGSAQGAA